MNRIKQLLIYVLSVHVTGLIILSLLRLVLLFTNIENITQTNVSISEILTALTKGVWFDNVIACYITLLPLITLSILGLTNFWRNLVIKVLNTYYILLYGVAFAISIADIPYFNYFFKHLNSSIFNWVEEGGLALSMMIEEKSYYIYFMIFILTLILFIYLILRYSEKCLRPTINATTKLKYALYIPLSSLLIASTFLGIRGKFGRNPIKTSQAYFSNNSFLNQLGLNPTFFFMRSILEYTEKHISINKLMEVNEAIIYAQQSLNIDEYPRSNQSPLSRYIDNKSRINNNNANVVIILMESMSAELLKKDNGKYTPYLNYLKEKSYSFENIYSTGNHTNQGIVATLYGLPSLFDKNMMKNVDIPYCYGIPNILKEKGYQTLFFVTHESQYDNMNAFLLENGIEKMYAQEDYPSSKIVNGFGVQDDYLFEYAIDKLNESSKLDRPFLSTILTISNHPPYIVPEKYRAISNEVENQIVSFADDAIRKFMEEAQKQPWYSNTIFVLLGDHGKIVDKPTYDMPLSYNHIPLIIYSPLFQDNPKIISDFGGQIDVFPTILGLLNYSYTNKTMGIDLLKDKRPYIYFTSDEALGCIDDQFLYIFNPANATEDIYRYKSSDPTKSIKEEYKQKTDSMRNYSASMLISTDYLLKNKLTR